MSIAAISSGFVSAVRERAGPAPVDAVAAPRALAQARHEGGRRHELVDAMKDVLGVDAPTGPSDEQSIFRFAQALIDRGSLIPHLFANGSNAFSLFGT